MVSWIIFTRISVFWEAFLLYNLTISITISSRQLELNVRLFSSTILFLIAFILVLFSYLIIVPFISSKWSSVGFIFDFLLTLPNFWTILTKCSLEILVIFSLWSIRVSFSTKFRILGDFTLFEKRGFRVCQKLLLSVTEDISSLAKRSFLDVRKRLPQTFRHFLYYFREVSVLLRKILLRSLERFVIALCSSFFMNLPWCDLRYFFLQLL